jgi:fluoride exporter
MGSTVIAYCWIAIGGAFGAMARYWCSGAAARLFGETFPWGTLIVNVSGSFIIGFFATLTGPDGRIFAGSAMRQFVMLGLLGGFTTFSSFSLQTLNLAQEGEWLRAGGNVVGSVVLCLVAVWLGHLLALTLNTMKGA